MLMRNKKDGDRINHFSIRKLSIGAASVLLSTTLYFGINSQELTVHAAETDSAIQSQKQNDDTSNDKVSTTVASPDKTSNQSIRKYEVSKAKETDETNDQQQPSAKAVYQSGDNVPSNDWFNVDINSGDLVNVRQGDTFQVTVGNEAMGLNYNQSPLDSTTQFNVINHGNGIYDFIAKDDFNSTSFSFNPNMSYAGEVTSAKTIDIPVTITQNNQIYYQTDIPLNVTPAPQQPTEVTHPDFYYKCFGPIAGTNKIAWGVYINYAAQEIGNLDIGLHFNGGQQVINDSISAYTPTGSELDTGITATTYPDSAYSYDISHAIQVDNGSNQVQLMFTKNQLGNNNLAQPVYVYFQTEIPGTSDEVQNSIKDDPVKYTCYVTGSISGKVITLPPLFPQPGDQGTDSEGSYTPSYKTDTKTVTETINYLEKGTNKVLANPYKAEVTFNRIIIINSVTGEEVSEGLWSQAQTFGKVESPTISGYTPDQTEIAAQTVDAKQANLVFNVYYSKNAPIPVSDSKTVKETINYLEKGTNKVLASAYAASLIFTRKGEKDAVTGDITWGNWSQAQTFGKVESPTISGYTPDQPEIAAQTVDAKQANLVFNVYYSKNAPIPVSDSKTVTETINYLEKGTNKVLASAYAASLIFTRKGEKDAVTGDITWGNWSPAQDFKAVNSPKVKGYTVETPVVGKQEVSNDSKDVVINVYYDKNESQNGPSEVMPIQTLDMNTVTETIHYVYRDSGESAAPDNIQKATFTRVGTDKGDGIVWGNWKPEMQTFKSVDSPEINGYLVSEQVVNGETVGANNKNIEVTVYYTPIPAAPVPHPSIEPTPTPSIEPTPDPDTTPKPHPQPKSDVSDISKPHATVLNHKSDVKQDVKNVVTTSIKNESKETLPQTGSRKTNLAIIGLGISALATLFSLFGFKKKEN